MSYHQSPNLGDILQVDLVGKIRKVIGLKYFLNHECNCDYTTKVNGTCAYAGECRSWGVVNKVMYKHYLSDYLVNTQNTLKKRMEQHFQDVAQKVQCDKKLDNFLAHFT